MMQKLKVLHHAERGNAAVGELHSLKWKIWRQGQIDPNLVAGADYASGENYSHDTGFADHLTVGSSV